MAWKIKNPIKQLGARAIKAVGNKYGHDRFVKIKKFILDEVRKHPVCKELVSHSKSNYVPGTLFGFLGFYADSDPVGDLLKFLEEHIEENNVFIMGIVMNLTKVKLPSFDQMAAEKSLQVPWASGVSWPQMIEDGVSGLQYFLKQPDADGNISEKSLSQEGLQSKNKVRDSDMPPVPFLTPIFEAAFSL